MANSCCDRRPAGPESCRLPLIPQILELMRIAWWEACESMFVASSTQKENTPNGRRTDTLSITDRERAALAAAAGRHEGWHSDRP